MSIQRSHSEINIACVRLLANMKGSSISQAEFRQSEFDAGKRHSLGNEYCIDF
jgi:hypothetical protein